MSLQSNFSNPTQHLVTDMKRLTSLSACQTEQAVCVAGVELVPASFAPSSLPAEGPARPHQLHSTGNSKTKTKAYYSCPLSNVLDGSGNTGGWMDHAGKSASGGKTWCDFE